MANAARGRATGFGDLSHKLRRRAGRTARQGFAWVANRKGSYAGPHARANVRWWKIVGEANRLATVYSYSDSAGIRAFRRSAAKFTQGLADTQARTLRSVALGIEPLFRAQRSQDKRRALDLARDARIIGEHEFSERVLNEILVADPTSPLTWSYLSDTHRARGALEEAHEARRKHLELTGGDSNYLSRVDKAFEELASLLRARQVEDTDSASAAQSLYDELRRLGVADGIEGAAPGTVRTALTNLTQRAKTLRAAEAVLWRASVHGTTAPDEDVAVARAYADASATRGTAMISEETARGLEIIDVSGFREYVTAKRVCVVANSEAVAESGLGEVIDAYDVVVRFNSFRLDAENTGTKTSVHALIHIHDFNWDVPVDVRMVFSGDSLAWRRSISAHVEQGAQRYLTDETLRWPVRSPQLVDDTVHPDIPTTGFNMTRLLDFLDVSTAIDLIGFDFYESGAFRLQEAMSLPIAAAHNYSAEKAWVLAHAAAVNGPITSLR